MIRKQNNVYVLLIMMNKTHKMVVNLVMINKFMILTSKNVSQPVLMKNTYKFII